MNRGKDFQQQPSTQPLQSYMEDGEILEQYQNHHQTQSNFSHNNTFFPTQSHHQINTPNTSFDHHQNVLNLSSNSHLPQDYSYKQHLVHSSIWQNQQNPHPSLQSFPQLSTDNFPHPTYQPQLSQLSPIFTNPHIQSTDNLHPPQDIHPPNPTLPSQPKLSLDSFQSSTSASMYPNHQQAPQPVNPQYNSQYQQPNWVSPRDNPSQAQPAYNIIPKSTNLSPQPSVMIPSASHHQKLSPPMKQNQQHHSSPSSDGEIPEPEILPAQSSANLPPTVHQHQAKQLEKKPSGHHLEVPSSSKKDQNLSRLSPTVSQNVNVNTKKRPYSDSASNIKQTAPTTDHSKQPKHQPVQTPNSSTEKISVEDRKVRMALLRKRALMGVKKNASKKPSEVGSTTPVQQTLHTPVRKRSAQVSKPQYSGRPSPNPRQAEVWRRTTNSQMFYKPVNQFSEFSRVYHSYSSQERLLVEFTESDFEDSDSSESENEDNLTSAVQPPRKKTREEEIEEIKIRLIRMNKCPSELFGSWNGKPEDESNLSPARKGPLFPPVPQGVVNSGMKRTRPQLGANGVYINNQRYPHGTGELNIHSIESLIGSGLSINSNEMASLRTKIAVFENVISKRRRELESNPITITNNLKSELTNDLCFSNSSVLQLNRCEPGNTAKETPEGERIPEQCQNMVDRREVEPMVGKSRLKPSSRILDTDKLPEEIISKGQQSMPQKSDQEKTSKITETSREVKKDQITVKEKKPLTVENQSRYYPAAPKQNVDLKSQVQSDSGNISENESITHIDETAWNKRQQEPKEKVSSKSQQDGLIRNLKSELKISRKQLTTVQDYSKQIHAAEISAAEAHAKLSFKRSRLESLEKELVSARREVWEAEQDYEKIKAAADRVKSTLEEIVDNDIEEIDHDINLEATDNDGNHTKQGTRSEIKELISQHDAKSRRDFQGEGASSETNDVIFKPSPFTPSRYQFHTSLSVLHAFVFRSPFYARVSDRKRFSPVSTTWTTKLDPLKVICPRDIHGRCIDKSCIYQHLPPVNTSVTHAVQVIDGFKEFFTDAAWHAFEKDIVGAKLKLYSGKHVDSIVTTLISSLCPSFTKAPLHRVT